MPQFMSQSLSTPFVCNFVENSTGPAVVEISENFYVLSHQGHRVFPLTTGTVAADNIDSSKAYVAETGAGVNYRSPS